MKTVSKYFGLFTLLLAFYPGLCFHAGYGTHIIGDLATEKPPRVFTMDGEALATLKSRIEKDPAAYADALALLKRQASDYLTAGPWTITTKILLPPSGDPHDYESQGPYWWPNPDTKDGLPYIRRDGEKNPEIDKLTDHKYLYEMTGAVKTLSIAYYLTGEEKFANRAALFLRTWFLDPQTKMNPHLKYGQRIPGITEGRNIGIIETRIIGEVADAIGLLQDAKGWSRADDKGMQAWMDQYLDWLLNSEHGKGEATQHNNHGTWYDVQVAALALFTGREDVARTTILRARDERLPKHIEPDGRQPHELARTKSWGYSVMNLQSFFTLATLGEKVGIDLWHHRTADGRSITKALDYLIQFADESNPIPWPDKQITDWSPRQIAPLLYQAACHFPERNYLTLARKLEGGEVTLNGILHGCASR